MLSVVPINQIRLTEWIEAASCCFYEKVRESVTVMDTCPAVSWPHCQNICARNRLRRYRVLVDRRIRGGRCNVIPSFFSFVKVARGSRMDAIEEVAGLATSTSEGDEGVRLSAPAACTNRCACRCRLSAAAALSSTNDAF